jgi:hypothetical protein
MMNLLLIRTAYVPMAVPHAMSALQGAIIEMVTGPVPKSRSRFIQ